MWFLLIDQLCNMVSANLFAAIPPMCHVADKQVSRKRWKTETKPNSFNMTNYIQLLPKPVQATSPPQLIRFDYAKGQDHSLATRWEQGYSMLVKVKYWGLTVSVLMWWNPLRSPEVLLKMEHTFEVSTYGKGSCTLELWTLTGPKSWLDVPFSKEMVANK